MKRTIALAILGAAALVAIGRGAAVDRTALAKTQAALTTEYGQDKD